GCGRGRQYGPSGRPGGRPAAAARRPSCPRFPNHVSSDVEATAFQTTTSTVSCRGSGEYVRTSTQAQRRSDVITHAVMPDLRSSHLIVPTTAVCAPHVAGERSLPVVTISRG